jgi:iron complex transport system substrate-binding protein
MNRYWRIVIAIAIALVASHNPCGAASGDQSADKFHQNFTLEIFGNANLDEDVDEKDVAYVEGVIKGTNKATNLSDANYDGKIDALDIDRIGEIINGKEKELTLIDTAGRTVTVHEPIDKMIEIGFTSSEVLRSLKFEKDKIVGVGNYTLQKKAFFPEFSKTPNVGDSSSPNYEQIIKLQPDLLLVYAAGHSEEMAAIEKTLKTADPKIVVVGFGFNQPSIFVKEVKTLSYILGKTSEADEFIEFYNKWIDTIWERTKDIPDSEKPKVYLETPYGKYGDNSAYGTSAGGHWMNERIVMAGGYNIFGDISNGKTLDVDPEEVMKRNPEIIVKDTYAGSYPEDNISALIAVRNEVMNRSELSNTTAVKNGRVYVVAHKDFFYGPSNFIAVAYLAKWFHPDLLKDLGDPQEFHQEYLTRFQGLDFDLNKHGTFVYPKPT